MHRRFEFVGGSSAKFWSVIVTGVHVVVRFGRIGTEGQQQTKSFSDANSAMKHAENLISGKLAKGYREVVAA